MKEGWHDRFVYRWHFDGRPVEKLSVGFAPEGEVHAGDILRRGNSAQEVLRVEKHHKYIKESPYPVGPGWWALLDTEIPQLYEIDPDLTGLEIKEKYGACQVDCWPSEAHWNHRDLLGDVASAIESQSAITCENCGAHITEKPTPETPYCERCFNLPTVERFAVREKTKENYFRGSYLRKGEPTDRGAVRGKNLADFLGAPEAEGSEQQMKTKFEEVYASVGKGWHGLLDKYLPQIYAIDPDCELIIKQKYGTLRIQPFKLSEGVSRNEFYAIAREAERASATVCEVCGESGSLRATDGFWIVTICDSCAKQGEV